MELWEEVLESKQRLQKEIREGGELKELPCPFCRLPRCRRSNYIRCARCGINWLGEEMHLNYKGKTYLDLNPLVARRALVRTATPTPSSATQLGEDAEKPIF